MPGKNCIISTMAAQVNYQNYYQVHIDERLYLHPTHSRQSQASLILHELIYGFLRKHYKHEDSGVTRNLVRYYISHSESITIGSVANAIYQMNLLSLYDREQGQAHKYSSIDIVRELNYNIEALYTDLREDYESEFSGPFGKELLSDIQTLADDPFIQLNSGKEFEEFLYITVEQNPNSADWQALLNRLKTQCDEFAVEIRNRINSSHSSLNFVLEEIYKPVLTEEEIKSIKYNFRVIIEDEIEELTYAYRPYEELHMVLVDRPLEWYFDELTMIYNSYVCEVTSESEETSTPESDESQNSQKNENEECYQQVKFETIIPK